MSKVRVFELAKDIGMQSKDLVEILNQVGVHVKNHMSAIDENAAMYVRRRFGQQPDKPAEQEVGGQKPASAEAQKPREERPQGPREAAGSSQPAKAAEPVQRGPQAGQTRQAPKDQAQPQRPREALPGQAGARPQDRNQFQMRPEGQRGERPQGRPGVVPQGQAQRPATPGQGGYAARPGGGPQAGQTQRRDEGPGARPAGAPQGGQAQRREGGPIGRPAGATQGGPGQRREGGPDVRPAGAPQGGPGQRPDRGRTPAGREAGPAQRSEARPYDRGTQGPGRNDARRRDDRSIDSGRGQMRPQGAGRPDGRPDFGRRGDDRRFEGPRPDRTDGPEDRRRGPVAQDGRPDRTFGPSAPQGAGLRDGGHRGRGPVPHVPAPPREIMPAPGEAARGTRRDKSQKKFEDDFGEARAAEGKEGAAKKKAKGKGTPAVKGLERRRGRITDFDLDEEMEVTPRRQRKRERPAKPKQIELEDAITVKDLAAKLNLPVGEVISKLIKLGVMANINQEIDFDTAHVLASEFGVTAELRSEREERELTIEDPEDPPETLRPRPPVVTIMGHVDHGKTSLLDAIRETNVAAGEAGGITQHIGAYQVEHNGRKITFLDTPGHEAFTAMRARGAQVTDVAVLVVAADDGVMPQTIEAINHAKAAGVPIVVAINKIDKPNAQPERVKQELSEQGLVPDDWGGDTVMVPVSALRKQGLEELLEMILLVADMRDLAANPDRMARGTVIEAELDRFRGPVATVLIQKGTLRLGDAFVAGEVYGRVRAMTDYTGKPVEEAGPSTPVEVVGFSDVPTAGDVFQAVADERLGRQVAERRAEKRREEQMRETRGRVTLEDLFKEITAGNVKELNIIVKADVQGSVEALSASIQRLSTDEVKVNIIHSGVGAVTESDIMLASASNAIVIGFQVRPDAAAKASAERENVDVRLYRVIYDALDDIKAAMSGLLEPEYREVSLGKAEVRQVFKLPKGGFVAGCYVSSGKITRNAGVRVIRDNVVVHEGKIASLKRFKDDVREVLEGFECGIGLEKFNDLKEGDVIEAFTTEAVKREL